MLFDSYGPGRGGEAAARAQGVIQTEQVNIIHKVPIGDADMLCAKFSPVRNVVETEDINRKRQGRFGWKFCDLHNQIYIMRKA